MIIFITTMLIIFAIFTYCYLTPQQIIGYIKEGNVYTVQVKKYFWTNIKTIKVVDANTTFIYGSGTVWIKENGEKTRWEELDNFIRKEKYFKQ